jgi:hypothetical protein
LHGQSVPFQEYRANGAGVIVAEPYSAKHKPQIVKELFKVFIPAEHVLYIAPFMPKRR